MAADQYVPLTITIRCGGHHLPFESPQAAYAAGVHGHALRCNHCGLYGAAWYPGLRPGYGSLVLCDVCAEPVKTELDRHNTAMTALIKVSYEQPPPSGGPT